VVGRSGLAAAMRDERLRIPVDSKRLTTALVVGGEGDGDGVLPLVGGSGGRAIGGAGVCVEYPIEGGKGHVSKL